MSRALGLLLGYAADRLLADPRRGHPVAGFGQVASAVERPLWRDRRDTGTAYVVLLVGGAVALGVLAERLTTSSSSSPRVRNEPAGVSRRPAPIMHTLLTAAATWAVLGGTSLDREVRAIDSQLAAGDLAAARQQLTHLVGRDTSQLDESEIVRATLESLAENTSDAVVSSLVWGSVAGMPGLLGHRAANTLDAMVGHRSARYERFGWAAAKLDDLLNLPGSRLSAALATLLGPNPRGAREAWQRDAADHPSPNAGPVEAAFAGALGVRLGGTNVYGDRVEHRAVMGSGRAPVATDLPRSRRLARGVDLAALVIGASAAAVLELRASAEPMGVESPMWATKARRWWRRRSGSAARTTVCGWRGRVTGRVRRC